MKKLSLSVVDDHKIYRDGLKLLLKRFPFAGNIHEAENGEQFLKQLEEEVPDIVLMDIQMPVMNGIETTNHALKKYSGLKIIALTNFMNEEYIDQMISLGAQGYMLKHSETDELESAIRKVYRGGVYFSDEVLGYLYRSLRNPVKETISNSQTVSDKFTGREMEILQLLCKGYSNAQIGENLFISPKTVEKHKSNLFQKTGSINTVNLVIYAFRNKLVKGC